MDDRQSLWDQNWFIGEIELNRTKHLLRLEMLSGYMVTRDTPVGLPVIFK